MFVDASAIVAILTGEPEARALADRLDRSPERQTSPIAVFEATTAVSRNLAVPVATAAGAVEEFLATARVEVVPVTADIGRVAIDAFARYGKGQRHAAQLNMGDCFAYACARHSRLPLLFKGNDFSETDIDAA